MRILSVVGARPQLVKLAPMNKALTENGIEHCVIHTGQHYDHRMSDIFFDEFGIPDPDVNLGVGSSSHAVQTARMMEGLEDHVSKLSPDWVLAYGDTNSTLAAALVCVKLGIPIAHIEAGLRSHNRSMPEEHNRVVTDHCSDLLFAPTETAMDFLKREGLGERSVMVGDVMIDILEVVRASLVDDPIDVPQTIGERGPFILATIHRQENTDNDRRLKQILKSLSDLHTRVIIAAHPRLVDRCETFGIDLTQGSLNPIAPLTYRELVATAIQAEAIVTDSGGLQKEAYFLGTLCSTVRFETEWPETLNGNWNMLVKDLSEMANIVDRPKPTSERGTPFGNGYAANKIVNILEDRF